MTTPAIDLVTRIVERWEHQDQRESGPKASTLDRITVAEDECGAILDDTVRAALVPLVYAMECGTAHAEPASPYQTAALIMGACIGYPEAPEGTIRDRAQLRRARDLTPGDRLGVILETDRGDGEPVEVPATVVAVETLGPDRPGDRRVVYLSDWGARGAEVYGHHDHARPAPAPWPNADETESTADRVTRDAAALDACAAWLALTEWSSETIEYVASIVHARRAR